MDRLVKSLSLLLSYPTAALQGALPEIAAEIVEDRRLAPGTRSTLAELTGLLDREDLFDLEENYVLLFDRSRTLSLNLFEHIHGESRDRGGAMVSLLETYRAAGYEPDTCELPDHLPALLEFLSTQPAAFCKETLADAAHILAALQARLVRRHSGYAAVFTALLELSEANIDSATLSQILEQPEVDPNDLAALDDVWEESEVQFGPSPDAGCPQAREMLAKMSDPETRAAPAAPATGR